MKYSLSVVGTVKLALLNVKKYEDVTQLKFWLWSLIKETCEDLPLDSYFWKAKYNSTRGPVSQGLS